jgi:hypothetical protein
VLDRNSYTSVGLISSENISCLESSVGRW